MARPRRNHAHALPDWLSLHGQIAVVTGGGTHLGLGMATALAELGATVLPARVGAPKWYSRPPTRCSRAGSRPTRSAPTRPTRSAWNRWCRTSCASTAGIDIMVCNAGGGVGTAMAPHIAVQDLDATLRQNLTTTLVSAQSAARAMMAATAWRHHHDRFAACDAGQRSAPVRAGLQTLDPVLPCSQGRDPEPHPCAGL